MLKLIIEDDEGRKTVVPFVREEITIGRQEGNTIRLTERNVSRRHARLMRLNGHVVVEDLGSSNGTRINGERISGQSPVKDGDLIQIGDYDLALQSDTSAQATLPPRSMRGASGTEDSADGHSEPETEAEAPVQDEEPNTSPAAGAAERRHSTAIIKMDQVEGNRSRKVQELEAEEAPRFVVVSAELRGQEYSCIRTEMKIGRTDDNDIVIDHRSLSRTHAKVVREDNGEWRIIDMQSANGLTVNGESYAQAPLNHGDVVELGHVKLKFVAAGEAVGSLGSLGRSKLPLALGLMGVLLAGGAGGAWFLKVGPFKEGPGPKHPEVVHQENPPQPQSGTPEPPEKSNPGTATADPAKALQGRLQSAQQAYDQGDFDKAIDELKNFNGTLPAEGQALLDKASREQEAQRALAEAREAFNQKKYDQVPKLAEPAKGSEHFGAKYDELMASLPQEPTPQVKTAEPVKPPPSPTNKPPAPPEANAQEQAKQFYSDAAKLLRARQYDQALTLASKCTQLTPENADCHMVLGAAYAGLSRWDEAAKHYREFLKLAPDHPNAPKVRQSVENYEKSKGNDSK
ncbi:MAG: FHA domain-containing protein [Hyalangium sp.]|uniref:FHA domain-containing protein n=1 Tax=Hyalangium sp. TaxID=2028555 RepID=UPI00389995D4